MSSITVEIIEHMSRTDGVRYYKSPMTLNGDQFLLFQLFQFYAQAGMKYGQDKTLHIWIKIEEGSKMTFEKECQGFGLLTVQDNLKVPTALLVPNNSTLLVEKFDANTWLFSGELLPKPQIVASNPFGADRIGHAHHTPSPEEVAIRREQQQEAVRIAHAHHLERERQREQEEDDDIQRAIALSLAGSGGGYDDDDYPYAEPVRRGAPPVSSPAGVSGSAVGGPGAGGAIDRTLKSTKSGGSEPEPAGGASAGHVGKARQSKELEIVAVDIDALGVYLSEEEAHKALHYTRDLISLYPDDDDVEGMDCEIYGSSSPLGASSSGLINNFDDDSYDT